MSNNKSVKVELKDWALLILTTLFAIEVFWFGVWVMDRGFPFSMFLGFVICAAAVLTFGYILIDIVEWCKDKFLNKS